MYHENHFRLVDIIRRVMLTLSLYGKSFTPLWEIYTFLEHLLIQFFFHSITPYIKYILLLKFSMFISVEFENLPLSGLHFQRTYQSCIVCQFSLLSWCVVLACHTYTQRILVGKAQSDGNFYQFFCACLPKLSRLFFFLKY